MSVRFVFEPQRYAARFADCISWKMGHTAAIYMDDILLHSRTWKEHISTIEVLIKTLQTNNLTANPKKCLWGYQNVTFWAISWVPKA